MLVHIIPDMTLNELSLVAGLRFGTGQEEQKLSPGTGKEAWIAAGAWYNRWGGS